MATRCLDDDEKMTLRSTQGHSETRGGAQSYNIISESGLKALVIGSRKPKAFKMWVTSGVPTAALPVQQEQDTMRTRGTIGITGTALRCIAVMVPLGVPVTGN